MILVLRCHITKLFVDLWAGRARHCRCLTNFGIATWICPTGIKENLGSHKKTLDKEFELGVLTLLPGRRTNPL